MGRRHFLYGNLNWDVKEELKEISRALKNYAIEEKFINMCNPRAGRISCLKITIPKLWSWRYTEPAKWYTEDRGCRGNTEELEAIGFLKIEGYI